MIGQSTYQAARSVASLIAEHFSQELAAARSRGEDGDMAEPQAAIIEALIDTAFWASLRREEGHSPKISLVLLPPWLAGTPLLFANRLPFTPETLTKLGSGVERAGIHVGVWYEGDVLYLWGTTRKIMDFCFGMFKVKVEEFLNQLTII